jgi:hypothetical protein
MNPAEILPGAKKGALGPDFLPGWYSQTGNPAERLENQCGTMYSHNIDPRPNRVLDPGYGFVLILWMDRARAFLGERKAAFREMKRL